MKWEHLARTILISAILITGAALLASCGSKPEATTTTTAAETTTAATTTAAPTPVVPAISGTLAPNVIADTPTWAETVIDPPKTMYVNVESDFLKVRKGPGKEYEQVASLTDGMEVIVAAKTDTNWYKLQDGYYVSADYLTDAP